MSSSTQVQGHVYSMYTTLTTYNKREEEERKKKKEMREGKKRKKKHNRKIMFLLCYEQAHVLNTWLVPKMI